jgi:hypothetical protein
VCIGFKTANYAEIKLYSILPFLCGSAHMKSILSSILSCIVDLMTTKFEFVHNTLRLLIHIYEVENLMGIEFNVPLNIHTHMHVWPMKLKF